MCADAKGGDLGEEHDEDVWQQTRHDTHEQEMTNETSIPFTLSGNDIDHPSHEVQKYTSPVLVMLWYKITAETPVPSFYSTDPP